MELTVLEANDTSLRAGYSCPCGCTPSVQYDRGAALVEEGCSRRPATARSSPRSMHRGDRALEAAWLVGPSIHGPGAGHDHDHDHDHDSGPGETRAVDPVCGMTVEPGTARATGLTSSYEGSDYYFCGKGCELEFDEDPKRYLDPSYMPSM